MPNLIPNLVYRHFVRQQYRGRLQAATMFVDMSGFTPLTETLMAHQKDGAEVLTNVLNQVFQPIVHQVYAHGGFISTFAGDAFTALFPLRRQEAVPHAAAAAFAIQQFFARHGLARTRYGDFVLSVRVGIGLGPVQWGIVGQADIYTYFFRGPGVAACIQAEKSAAAGEVVVTPALAHGLGDCAYTVPIDNYLRISPGPACPQPQRQRLALLDREAARPFILNEVVDLKAPAEFRNVACVFISFEQPETASQLNAFATQVLEEALRYDGYFNKLDFGDKGPVMLIVFGAPLAHEDDVARAADFVLSLRERNQVIRWRAGLTAGTVYAGFIGGKERGEYTVIGDVVNLASRVMQRARGDNIWLSEGAALQIKSTHQVQSLGKFSFKGKRGTLPIYCLDCRKALIAPALHAGVMAGRQQELAELTAFARPIWEGRLAGVACIYGEAGAGKSRLAYELQQHLVPLHTAGRREEVKWLVAHADPILRRAFYPFSHLLRRYFDQGTEVSGDENQERFKSCLAILQNELARQPDIGDLCAELDRATPALAALIGLHWPNSPYNKLDAQGRYQNTLLAIRTLLLAESRLQPVVLQVEDGQWLDDASRAVLVTLTQDSAEFPLLVLVTSRYGDDGSRPVLEGALNTPTLDIHLRMLAPAEVEALASAFLRGAISNRLRGLLLDRTQANPFFIQQLLAYFRESNLLYVDQGKWQAPAEIATAIPHSINAVLVARIDRLPAVTRDVVKAAAVLGREFEMRVLESVMGADLQPAIRDAATAQIWTAQSEGRYAFRHTLLRDAAYGMQLRVHLRRLHQQAAEAIASLHAADLDNHYAELAYHYGQAGDVAHEMHYAVLAGDAAVQVSAFYEALGFFERALALLPEEAAGERAALHLRLGEMQVQLGNYGRAQEHLTQVQELAGQQGNTSDEANALYHLSVAAHRQGEYTQAQALLNQALPLARADNNQETLARVLFGLGGIAWRVGRMAEAWDELEESLALARALDRTPLILPILNNLGTVAVLQERLAVAQELFEECRALARAVGDRSFAATTLNNLGEVAGLQGDFAARKQHILAALEIYRETGQQDNVAMTLLNLSETFIKIGEPDQAANALQEGLGLAQQMGAVPIVLAGLTILARLNAVQGRLNQALALLGLVRSHPAANSDIQRVVAETIADLGTDEATVRAGLIAGEKLVLGEVVAATLASTKPG